ncbi:unnamed protein product [Cuscuta epithymum]|uniref:Uncharacterized protein n=1 Tax=Cuscuta epithymum TaxID=186058 RepID=A0AAV0EZ51_9ASTE|nr:unnamed protein product [Cuscuta epithymum]
MTVVQVGYDPSVPKLLPQSSRCLLFIRISTGPPLSPPNTDDIESKSVSTKLIPAVCDQNKRTGFDLDSVASALRPGLGGQSLWHRITLAVARRNSTTPTWNQNNDPKQRKQQDT